jgi:hypothetical protein
MAAVITGPPPAQPPSWQEIGNGQRSEAFPAPVSETKFEERPLRGANLEFDYGTGRPVRPIALV